MRPRILSLVPSATDWVVQLGMGEHLVGCTHECEAPDGVPVVVTPAVHHDPSDPAGVDAAVTAAAREGRALYTLDAELVTALAPTLVLTQQLCDVCAVSAGQIHRLAQRIAGLEVVSMDGVTLEGVLDDGLRAGAAMGVADRADALVRDLLGRLAAVAAAVTGAERRRVAFLEWSDPPWVAGHWVPDQIAAAGGRDLAGRSGEPSARAGWDAFAGADVLVVGPCGYVLPEAVDAAAGASAQLPEAGAVWAVDAHRCWSRPAPGLVDGVESLAGILHPDRCAPPDPAVAQRVELGVLAGA